MNLSSEFSGRRQSLRRFLSSVLGTVTVPLFQDAVLKHLYALPGGRALLDEALKNGTYIFLAGALADKNAGGVFDFRSGGKSRAGVRNNFDAIRMAITLYHELRHAKQWHQAKVRYSFADLRDPLQTLSVILLIEADAFTQQAMTCLRKKQSGDSRYLDKIYERNDLYASAVQEYIAITPYPEKESDQAYARGLFAHILTSTLLGYRMDYFLNMGREIAQCQTPQDLVKMVEATSPSGIGALPPDFKKDYGEDFMASLSAQGIKTAIARALPLSERMTLSKTRALALACKNGVLNQNEFETEKEKIQACLAKHLNLDTYKNPSYYSGQDEYERRVLNFRAAAFEKTAPAGLVTRAKTRAEMKP